MRLLRLEVWNWRGLDHAVLGELAPDLNLVVGPNESGKSRLFEALRYALFERYKGESEEKKRLRTWGGSESPTVEVDFVAGGGTWRLRKRWLKGAAARLEGGGGTWADDEAEERLRQLWGTKPIRGRTNVEQFLGLWPLLWVQQGKAGLAPHLDLNDDARARLTDALAVHVREVVAGQAGQKVLARVEAERALYCTPTGKERGDLQAARARRDVAASALEDAAATRERGRLSADELARLETALAEGASKLDSQRKETEATRKRVEAARDRAAALRTHRAEGASLATQRELARQRLEERAHLEDEARALAGEIDQHEKAMTAIDARTRDLRDRSDQARRFVEQAERDEEQAALARVRAGKEAERAQAAREVDRLRGATENARRHSEAVHRLEQQLLTLPAGEKEMKALRRAREAFARANAALTAASARVRVRAIADLVMNGQPLAAGQERDLRLDEPTSIRLEDVAEIHISPAGAELHRLRDEERDARQLFEAHLAALGAESIADAEERHRRRLQGEAERKQHEALLAQIAPEGIEVLEGALRLAEGKLGAAAGGAPDHGSLEAAEERLSKAQIALRQARASRDVAERELARANEEYAVRRGRLLDTRGRFEAASSRLAAMPPREELARALAEADSARARVASLLEALTQELQRRGDLDAETELEHAERALEQLGRVQREREDRSIELLATVRHLGAEGVHEEVQQRESELEDAARELERVARRAAAARVLFDALSLAQREVQERLVAPVREKVEPYLQGLLPEVGLELDEQWNVKGLRSGNRMEDFDALSGGAREQVGLLVRLGLAEVLGEAEPLPIVLDDCLVNTDPERHRDMLRILYRASKKQQIVLFSCHDVAFDRLGATRRYDLPPRRVR